MVKTEDKMVIGLCLVVAGLLIAAIPVAYITLFELLPLGIFIPVFLVGVGMGAAGVCMTLEAVREYGSAQAQDLEYEHKDDEKNQGVKSVKRYEMKDSIFLPLYVVIWILALFPLVLFTCAFECAEGAWKYVVLLGGISYALFITNMLLLQPTKNKDDEKNQGVK